MAADTAPLITAELTENLIDEAMHYTLARCDHCGAIVSITANHHHPVRPLRTEEYETLSAVAALQLSERRRAAAAK